jgi:hypothetical protein
MTNQTQFHILEFLSSCVLESLSFLPNEPKSFSVLLSLDSVLFCKTNPKSSLLNWVISPDSLLPSTGCLTKRTQIEFLSSWIPGSLCSWSFLQNKPKYPHFQSIIKGCRKKQSQIKANQQATFVIPAPEPESSFYETKPNRDIAAMKNQIEQSEIPAVRRDEPKLIDFLIFIENGTDETKPF